MFKLTKASRYIEENMVKQFCQRAAPQTEEKEKADDGDIEMSFTIVEYTSKSRVKPDNVYSCAEVVEKFKFENDNYFGPLVEDDESVIECDSVFGKDIDLEDDMYFDHEEREDHFVLYKGDILVHWQLVNNKELHFVCQIEEEIDLPLYISAGMNVSPLMMMLYCKCDQDVYEGYPYNEEPLVRFIAYDQSNTEYDWHLGVPYEVHAADYVPDGGSKKRNKNKKQNKKNFKKPKPWVRDHSWKHEDTSSHKPRVDVEHAYEVRVREHVISMKKTCASLSAMKSVIPLEIYREFPNIANEGVNNSDIKDLIMYYHAELHSGTIEEPIDVILRYMRNSTLANNEGLSMFENIMSTLVVLRYTTHVAGVIAALTLFAKLMIGNNTPILQMVLDIFTEETGNVFGLKDNSVVELQAATDVPSATFTDTFNKLKSYTLHPSRKHIATLVSAMVTVGLLKPQYFSYNGFKIFAAEAFDKTANCNDIVDATLQSIAFFMDTGYKCFKTFSFSPFINAMDSISEFRSLVHFLYSNIDTVKLGNYELLHNESLTEYENKMVRARQMVGSVIPNAIYTKSEFSQDVNKLTKVELEHSFFLQAQGLRETPYAILLFGPSSVGKSYLMRKLTEHILMVNGFKHDDSAYCYLNCHSKFYDSLKSNTQCICLDEIANSNPSTNQVNECDFILNILNNVFFAAPMAEAHQKGKVMVNNKVFAATTNVAEINASYWSQEPLAVLRRFQCRITARVKPAYATKGQMLDTDKALADFPNDQLQDVWLFTVEYARGVAQPADKEIAHAIPAWSKHFYQGKPLVDVSIITLMKWLVEHSRAHFAKQKAVIHRSKNKMPVCDKCQMFWEVCPCDGLVPHPNVRDVTLVESEVNHEQLIKVPSMVNKLKALTSRNKEKLATIFEKDLEVQAGLLTNPFIRGLITEYVANPMYDEVSNWCSSAYEIICPSYREKRLYNMHRKAHAALNFSYFNNSKFSWVYEVLPHWFLMTKFFERSYTYLERHNMLMAWRHSMLFVSIFIGRLLYLELFRTGGFRFNVLMLIVGLWCFLSFACASYVMKRFNDEIVKRQDAAEIRELSRKQLQGSDSDDNDWRSKMFRVAGGAATLAAGAVFISALVIAYDKWKETNTTCQSALDPANEEEIAKRDETKNPWKTTPLFADDVKATHTTPQLLNTVRGNIMHMSVAETKKHCNAVMLCTDAMIFPYHMWFQNGDFVGNPLAEMNVTLITAPSMKDGKPITGNTNRVRLNWSNTYRVPNTDLVLAYVVTGPRRDLRKYLTDLVKMGQYSSLSRDHCTGEVTEGYGVIKDTLIHQWPNSDCTGNHYSTRNSIEWTKGMCCTALFSNDSNPSFIGLHLIGYRADSLMDKKEGFALVLNKTQILDAYSKLMKMVGVEELHAEGVLPLTVCGKPINYQSKISVSPLNWIHQAIDQPVFTYYGMVDGGFTATSDVRTSVLADDLQRLTHIPHVWGPPNFNPPDESGVKRKWIPWHTGLLSLTDPCYTIDSEALKWAINDFAQPIYEAMSKVSTNGLRPLTNSEILNGIPGKRFVDKMNFKSSMGFPLSGHKSKYLVIDPRTGLADFADAMFWNEMEKCEITYLRGEVCNHIFKACLKDEVTKHTPGKVKKARIFQAAPILLQLLTRKYFLPVLREYCLRPIRTECAVGINCFSLEWEELFSTIMKFLNSADDKGIFAGDYQAWDQKVSKQLVIASLSVMINVAKRSGNYTENDIVIMRGIMTELACCLINFNGSLLRFQGMMPSGHNLTAVLNSNANSLLVRVAYYDLHKQAGLLPRPFRENVSLSTYGDDIYGSVNSSVRHVFNIKTYASYLKTQINMVFTMPDKGDKLSEFLSPLDKGADFLKRHSQYVEGLVNNDGNPVRVGVIGLESIVKSLYCVRCSKAQEKNNLSATMMSALHELFFHGREVYGQWCQYFDELCSKHNIVLPIQVPSFDERIVDWKCKYLENTEIINGTLSDNVSNIVSINNHCVDVMVTQCSEPEAYIDESTLEDLVADKSFLSRPVDWGPFKVLHRSNEVMNIENKNDGVSDQYTQRSPLRDNGLQLHAGGSEVVTSFNMVDGDESMVQGVVNDINLNTQHTPTDLKEFFRRPIRIQSYELEIGENVAIDINPVSAYLTNTRVSNRINNYAWFKGTMCVKFETNGSNFHYGRYIAAVNHFKANDTVYQQTGVPMTACTVLPHIMIDPTDATGGCLEIPLFHPMNMIPFRNMFDLVTVHLRSINPLTLLKISDPVNSVTLNVWAWFKDIELSMPTQFNNAFLEPQAGDEYDKPSVVATSAADMVGHLRDAPVVGPYARATELALRGAAQVASAFGYSRPSVTNDNGRMIIHPAGNLSNVNVIDTATKLAFDAKQEVTVDQTVTGFAGDDSMDIAAIAQKRMLINKFDWSRLETSQAPLFLMNVTPMQTKLTVLPDPGGDSPSYLISPACHMAAPFKYWRGSMEITIEVVASTFHKGKLRVVYDPLGVMANDNTDWQTNYNVNYSAVIDIAQSRTYTMRVGWGNARSYCLTGEIERLNSITDDTLADLASNNDNAYANGRLGICVLTPLTSVAGIDTNVAYVNIYANMCDDFQIAVPQCGSFTRWSTNAPKTIGEDEDFKYQAGDLEEVPGPMVAENAGVDVLLNGTANDSQLWESKFNRVHIGEEIKSIRQVIKRYCPSTYIPFQIAFDIMAPSIGSRIFFQYNIPNFPQFGGYSFLDTGGGPPNPFVLVTGAGVAYIPVTGANWLTWYAPAFLMRKGAIRQKYLIEGGLGSDFQIESYHIINNSTSSGLSISVGSELTAGATTEQILSRKGLNYPTTSCGSFTNYPTISNVLDGETPFQSDRSWYFSQNRNMEEEYLPESLRNESSHKVWAALAVAAEETTGGLRRYTAAGEDFSFIYYKYPPLVIKADFTP